MLFDDSLLFDAPEKNLPSSSSGVQPAPPPQLPSVASLADNLASKRSLFRSATAVDEWDAADARRARRYNALMAACAHAPPWRRKVLQVVHSIAFERTIYVILSANCMLLSFQNIKSFQAYQAASDVLDAIFTACYFVEMILKIVALGIGFHTGYLSAYWNWIDGSITMISIGGLLVGFTADGAARNTGQSIARALRLIRPLRMLTALSSLRTLLRALGASVSRLGNVALLTASFLAFMSLIGLAFFRHVLDTTCQSVTLIANDSFTQPVIDYGVSSTAQEVIALFLESTLNASNATTLNASSLQWNQDGAADVCVNSGNVSVGAWMWNLTFASLVSLDSSAVVSAIEADNSLVVNDSVLTAKGTYVGVVCPFGQYCVAGSGPDNGYSSFNTIFSTGVLLYTVISLEGWSYIMFYVMDALGPWVAVYFVVNVIVGTIFILNLVLATVSDGFSRSIRYQKSFEIRQLRRKHREAEQAGSTGRENVGEGNTASSTNSDNNDLRGSSSGATWSGMLVPMHLALDALPQLHWNDRIRSLRTRLRLTLLLNQYYQYCRVILASFSATVLAATISDMDTDQRDSIFVCTATFTCFFFTENVLEIFILGRRFVEQPLLVLDFIVSVASVAEFALGAYPTIPALRLFRLLELMMMFPSLRKQIRVLVHSIRGTLSLLLFMTVLLFLGSLVGVQLFSGKFCGFDTTSPYRVDTSLCNNVPRTNFDNIGYAASTVFVIFCGDGWRAMMVNGMQALGDYAAIYFCICYLLGGYLMLNLFVAVLITSAEAVEEEPEVTIVRSHRMSLLDNSSLTVPLLQPVNAPPESELSMDGDHQLEIESSQHVNLGSSFTSHRLLEDEDDETLSAMEERNRNWTLFSSSRLPSIRRDSMPLATRPSAAQLAPQVSSLRKVTPSGRIRRKSVAFVLDDKKNTEDEEMKQLEAVLEGATGSSVEDATLASGSVVAHRPRSGSGVDSLLLGDDALHYTERSTADRILPEVEDDEDDDDKIHLSANLLAMAERREGIEAVGRSSNKAPPHATQSEGISTSEFEVIDGAAYNVDTYRTEVRQEYKKQIRSLPLIRRLAGSVVKSRKFDTFYHGVVFYSMITLMVESRIDYPNSARNQFSGISDLIVALFFFIEAILKMIHHGIFHRKGALLKGYINFRWNIFDFVIMLCSLVVALSFFSSNRVFLRVADWFRITRAMRPFSLIGRRDGLKLVARSAVASLPSIRNIGLITLLVWITFSILGLLLFCGRFNACTSVTWGDMTYQAGNITTKEECLAANYSWAPPRRNFDTLGNSLLTMFQITSVDNWDTIMYLGIDSRSPNEAPRQRSRMWVTPFFVVYILLTTFFLLQFFVASMCQVYFEQKEVMEERLRDKLIQSHEVFLDNKQKVFLGMYRRALYFVKPPLHVEIVDGTLRTLLRRVVRHRAFEPMFTLVATVHIIIEALSYAQSPPLSSATLLTLDWIMTAVFVTVNLGTWYVYGSRNFFESSRGRLTTLINLLTVIGLILATRLGVDNNSGKLLRELRTFRLFRVFYLSHSMQILVDTIVYSLPNFLNVLFLLFLIFFVYAAVGMQLFGRLRFSDTATSGRSGIGHYANFAYFDKAMIVLLRVATFDDWTELMYASAVEPPSCLPELGECTPHPLLAYFYFLSFAVVGQWIGLNFFAAEILNAFTHAEEEERYAIQKKDVDRFQRLWKTLVGSGEGAMPFPVLIRFIEELGPPIGPDFSAIKERMVLERAQQGKADWDVTSPVLLSSATSSTFVLLEEEEIQRKIGASRLKVPTKHVLQFMKGLHVPLVHNEVMQGTLFDALIRKFYETPLPDACERSLRAVLNSRFQTKQFLRKIAKVPNATLADYEMISDAVGFTGRPLPTDEDEGEDQQSLVDGDNNRRREEQGSAGGNTNVSTLRMMVAATAIQSRWRGARIRELVKLATGKLAADMVAANCARQFKRRRNKSVIDANLTASRSMRMSPRRSSPSKSPATPITKGDSGTRARGTSISLHDQPSRKIHSIAERLKAKHSDLI